MRGIHQKMIHEISIPTVLLLAKDTALAHSIRETVRRAGLTIALRPVTTHEEFLSRLQTGSVDLVLTAVSGLPDKEIAEILESVRELSPRSKVVVIGQENQGPAIHPLKDHRSDYVHISYPLQLPLIMERILREQRSNDAHAQTKVELEQVADMLRENQKLITIGRLTGTIVHEINNPLESMSNLLYLMEMEHADAEKCLEYLKMAQRELARVMQISKQTLNFYRETSEPVRVQLSDLLEEVLGLYARRIADKNLRVQREFESSEFVSVFPGEVRQVLSNLIANAIEASGRNGRLLLRIRNSRKWSDEGVQGVRLSVADNGTGISNEVRERLGEPFFTTKGERGTGLGLWVTRRILSRYGGDLQLRSSTTSERHGTVFSMFLPTNMRPQMVAGGGAQGGLAARGGGAAAPRLRLLAGPGNTLKRVNGE